MTQPQRFLPTLWCCTCLRSRVPVRYGVWRHGICPECRMPLHPIFEECSRCRSEGRHVSHTFDRGKRATDARPPHSTPPKEAPMEFLRCRSCGGNMITCDCQGEATGASGAIGPGAVASIAARMSSSTSLIVVPSKEESSVYGQAATPPPATPKEKPKVTRWSCSGKDVMGDLTLATIVATDSTVSVEDSNA